MFTHVDLRLPRLPLRLRCGCLSVVVTVGYLRTRLRFTAAFPFPVTRLLRSPVTVGCAVTFAFTALLRLRFCVAPRTVLIVTLRLRLRLPVGLRCRLRLPFTVWLRCVCVTFPVTFIAPVAPDYIALLQLVVTFGFRTFGYPVTRLFCVILRLPLRTHTLILLRGCYRLRGLRFTRLHLVCIWLVARSAFPVVTRFTFVYLYYGLIYGFPLCVYDVYVAFCCYVGYLRLFVILLFTRLRCTVALIVTHVCGCPLLPRFTLFTLRFYVYFVDCCCCILLRVVTRCYLYVVALFTLICWLRLYVPLRLLFVCCLFSYVVCYILFAVVDYVVVYAIYVVVWFAFCCVAFEFARCCGCSHAFVAQLHTRSVTRSWLVYAVSRSTRSARLPRCYILVARLRCGWCTFTHFAPVCVCWFARCWIAVVYSRLPQLHVAAFGYTFTFTFATRVTGCRCCVWFAFPTVCYVVYIFGLRLFV